MLVNIMRKTIRVSLYSLVGVLGISVATQYGFRALKESARTAVSNEVALLQAEVNVFKNREVEQAKKLEELKQIELHIVKSMLLTKARLTEVQKATIVSTLSTIAVSEFSNFEQRELWIAVIAQESKFNPKAESPAGALGIGQVMPTSADWYGEQCGITDITKQDLYDIRINAMISACIFNALLVKTNGSPSLALVSYNAGEFSKDVKNIDKMVNINTESANYVAKITRFLEKTRSVNILTK